MEFKNVSGDDLDLPTLDLRVAAGDTVEITGDPAKSLLSNPHFERADKPRTTKSEEQ